MASTLPVDRVKTIAPCSPLPPTCVAVLSGLRQNWESLVIGGGAAHGVVMAGAMTQLFPTDIEFRVWRRRTLRRVSGTSIGAVLCLGYAVGIPPRVMLREMQMLPWERLVTPTLAAMARGSMSSGVALDEYMRGTLVRLGVPPDTTLAQVEASSGMEVHIVVNVLLRNGGMTCEVWTGRNHAAHFSIFTALRGTVSLPGVFPPAIDPLRRFVVDGGIMCNTPLHTVPRDKALLLRTSGAEPDGVPQAPLTVSDIPLDNTPVQTWWRLACSVMQGLRMAADVHQANRARFLCTVWSKAVASTDVRAGPGARARAALDGRRCARIMIAAWTVRVLAAQKQT
jgi:hypothetical protein